MSFDIFYSFVMLRICDLRAIAACTAALAAACAWSGATRTAALLAMSASRMGSGCEKTRQLRMTATAVSMLHMCPTLKRF